MAHEVEREWEAHGLDCAVLFVNGRHYNGYVKVPPDHPWFGKDYSDEVDGPPIDLDSMTYGEAQNDFGVIPMFILALKGAQADDVGEAVSEELQRIDMRIRVHGGITFGGEPYFGDEKGWCFGFDTAHADDTVLTCDAEYVARQTERMAEQLAGIGLVASATSSDLGEPT